MKTKIFYRVANKSGQGLWYNQQGEFTGLIHNEYSFCKNSNLLMPYDKNIVGWLSAAKTGSELQQWFPVEDLLKLEEFGYYFTVYETTQYKKYANHWIIKQDKSKQIGRINPTLLV